MHPLRPPSHTQRPHGLIDVVPAILGANVWAAMALVPMLHLEADGLAGTRWLTATPLGILLLGLWRHSPLLLLGAYPISLVALLSGERALLREDVYTPKVFVLVAVSLLAYATVTQWFLARSRRLTAPVEERDLEIDVAERLRWRHRRRIYRHVAALAGLFPLTLLHALFLRERAWLEFAEYYPQRPKAAAAVFGMVVLGLWLLVFLVFFARPLLMHLRGDPQLPARIQKIEHSASLGWPFFLAAAVAVAAVATLLLRL